MIAVKIHVRGDPTQSREKNSPTAFHSWAMIRKKPHRTRYFHRNRFWLIHWTHTIKLCCRDMNFIAHPSACVNRNIGWWEASTNRSAHSKSSENICCFVSAIWGALRCNRQNAKCYPDKALIIGMCKLKRELCWRSFFVVASALSRSKQWSI